MAKAKEWSSEEIEILKRHYKQPRKDIQKLLPDRSVLAIRHKLLNLNLMKRQMWSNKEVEILTANFGKSAKDLQKLLPTRSIYGIQHILKKLRLVKRERGRPWTDNEIEILRENYPKMTLQELKERFFPDRSAGAILAKASRELGLRKPVTFWCADRGRSEVRDLSISERYYLAGIMDGEGTISIRPVRRSFYSIVSIANSSFELIKRCREMIGAKVNFTEKRRGKWKTVWVYQISSRPDVKKLLTQLRDALISKRAQCELALRFLELMDNRPNINEYPEEVYRIYEEVKYLNKRGP